MTDKGGKILNGSLKQFHWEEKLEGASMSANPVKIVTWVSSCLFDSSSVENDIKSDGNSIIFLVNAMRNL